MLRLLCDVTHLWRVIFCSANVYIIIIIITRHIFLHIMGRHLRPHYAWVGTSHSRPPTLRMCCENAALPWWCTENKKKKIPFTILCSSIFDTHSLYVQRVCASESHLSQSMLLSLTHTHTHTIPISLYLCLSVCVSHSLSLSLSPSISISLSLSLTLPYTLARSFAC